MIRVRPLAELLANPDQVQENHEGDQVPLNDMEDQSAQEVETRKKERAERLRRWRIILNLIPPSSGCANRPWHEIYQGDPLPTKISLEEFVEYIMCCAICRNRDLGAVPDLVRADPEDDVFLEEEERGDYPLFPHYPYNWRRKLLLVRHFLIEHPSEYFFRGERLFVDEGRIEVTRSPLEDMRREDFFNWQQRYSA